MDEINPYQPPSDLAAAAAGPQGTGQYEFDELENLTIARTAKFAKVWGVFALIIGVLLLVAIIVALVLARDIAWEMGADPTLIMGIIAGLSPLAVVNLVIGWLYIASGSSLRAVVDTEGNDVELMLSGLNRLANAFRIEAIVTVIALIGGFILGLALASGEEVAPWMQ
jgi:hypothetical protein